MRKVPNENPSTDAVDIIKLIKQLDKVQQAGLLSKEFYYMIKGAAVVAERARE